MNFIAPDEYQFATRAYKRIEMQFDDAKAEFYKQHKKISATARDIAKKEGFHPGKVFEMDMENYEVLEVYLVESSKEQFNLVISLRILDLHQGRTKNITLAECISKSRKESEG